MKRLLILAILCAGCTARDGKENAVGVYNHGVRKTSEVQVGMWNTAVRSLKVIGDGTHDMLNEVTGDE